MLNNLPLEILTIIINFLPISDILTNIFVSKKFNNLIICTRWDVHKFVLFHEKDLEFLHKFKFNIQKLKVSKFFENTIPNLTKLNYRELYLFNVDFSKYQSLIDFDSQISNKCEKLTFNFCIGYSKSLLSSFMCLVGCKNIKFHDELDCDYYDILNCFKKLPKLRQISLYNWILNQECLCLLADYEMVKLKNVKIHGNIDDFYNYTCIHLSSCLLNRQIMINNLLVGKKFKNK